LDGNNMLLKGSLAAILVGDMFFEFGLENQLAVEVSFERGQIRNCIFHPQL
jgi:hypothetical protein